MSDTPRPGRPTGRWSVCSCWTYEASLSGYDEDEVISTHDTREEALAERDRVYRDHIGTVDTDSGKWCIGVGIGPELEVYATSAMNEPDEELHWADAVPDEFLALEEAQQ